MHLAVTRRADGSHQPLPVPPPATRRGVRQDRRAVTPVPAAPGGDDEPIPPRRPANNIDVVRGRGRNCRSRSPIDAYRNGIGLYRISRSSRVSLRFACQHRCDPAAIAVAGQREPGVPDTVERSWRPGPGAPETAGDGGRRRSNVYTGSHWRRRYADPFPPGSNAVGPVKRDVHHTTVRSPSDRRAPRWGGADPALPRYAHTLSDGLRPRSLVDSPVGRIQPCWK